MSQEPNRKLGIAHTKCLHQIYSHNMLMENTHSCSVLTCCQSKRLGPRLRACDLKLRKSVMRKRNRFNTTFVDEISIYPQNKFKLDSMKNEPKEAFRQSRIFLLVLIRMIRNLIRMIRTNRGFPKRIPWATCVFFFNCLS